MHVWWWIILGVVTGWLTGKQIRGPGYGPSWDVLTGVIGAVVCGWAMRFLGFSHRAGVFYTTVFAIFGAFALTAIVRALTRGPLDRRRDMKRAA